MFQSSDNGKWCATHHEQIVADERYDHNSGPTCRLIPNPEADPRVKAATRVVEAARDSLAEMWTDVEQEAVDRAELVQRLTDGMDLPPEICGEAGLSHWSIAIESSPDPEAGWQ